MISENFRPKRITVWRERAGIKAEMMATLLGMSLDDFVALERAEYSANEADIYAIEITFGGTPYKVVLGASDGEDNAHLARMTAGFRRACKEWGFAA